MNSSLEAHFEAMLTYRQESLVQNRKKLRKRYHELYAILFKQPARLLFLSKKYLGYSQAETLFATLHPLFLHYYHCLSQLRNTRYRLSPLTYPGFSQTIPAYTLRVPVGILLVRISGVNPLFYSLATLLSAILYYNSGVFFFEEVPKGLWEELRKMLSPLLAPEEFSFFHESELSWDALRALPFHECYSFSSAVQVKNTPSQIVGAGGRLHIAVVDKEVEIKQVASEIFYAKTFNAGASDFSLDAVFVDKALYPQFVKTLLLLAKKKNGAHNFFTLRDVSVFQKTKALLPQLEAANYRVLNPHALLFQDEKTLRFDSLFVEKLEPYAKDIFLSQRLLHPILPLVAYERIEDLTHFFNVLPSQYQLFIFSARKRIVNQLIQETDGNYYCVNSIFATSLPRLTHAPLPHTQNSLYPFSKNKQVLIKPSRPWMGHLPYPPFLSFKAKYLSFLLFMQRFRKEGLFRG